MSGYTQSRILNSDSSFSKFSGTNYGLQLEISLTQSQTGDIRIFGQWGSEDLKATANGVKLKSDHFAAGLKFYANSWFFLQAGYGEADQAFSGGTDSYKVKNSLLTVATGFDYSISENVSLGVMAQYSTNPIKKTAAITSNSFSEAGQYLLTLTWSPPITIINSTSNAGR